MTPDPAPPARRRVRTLLDIVLRTGGLFGCAAVTPTLSGETDALALGLTAFFTLAAFAFAAGVLDGWRERDHVRLVVVWAVVTPLVALLEMADNLRAMVTGPGAYPSLGLAFRATQADLVGSFVLFAALVGVPAAAGIGLGLLLRLPEALAVRPSGPSGAPFPAKR